VIAAVDEATDIGDIIEASGCGLKALNGDMNSFHKAVEILATSEENRKQMGEKGYQLFLNQYTTKKSYEVIAQHFQNDNRILTPKREEKEMKFHLKQTIKQMLIHYQTLSVVISFIYTYLFGLNSVIGKMHNKIEIKNSYLRRCHIKIRGKNNKIYVGNQTLLNHCKINITGNDNTIILGERVSAVKCNIHIEDNHNFVRIGKGCHISGITDLACMEGCNLIIGENCLFSSEIDFRTGDSHSILDWNGNRTNPSQSIEIGNHVWIGNRTIITKGVRISENSIVATGAVVTKKFEESNIIIGGVPAQIIKRNVNWDESRIGWG
jgi:acetyltransferase-like isoleucine patch superfamily enzyme